MHEQEIDTQFAKGADLILSVLAEGTLNVASEQKYEIGSILFNADGDDIVATIFLNDQRTTIDLNPQAVAELRRAFRILEQYCA